MSGPYTIRPDDVVTDTSITVTRRDDEWAADNPVYEGMYNIDAYRALVIADQALGFEKFKIR